jgi:ribonuclease BN (tRNA processing enzyme)
VEGGGARVAIDLGMGALTGLLRAGVTHRDLDAVFLTHRHPDHLSELLPFFFACNYAPPPRKKKFLLAGGPDTLTLISGVSTVFGRWVEARTYSREVLELSEGAELLVGALSVATGPADHIESSISYRVTLGGRSAVITGDTGPSGEFAVFASGADILIAEASRASDNPADGHLTPVQAGELAKAARVKKLVLTHIQPETEAGEPVKEAKSAFGGEVILGFDGLKLEL